MSTLLTTWSVTVLKCSTASILPDGCRDLICWEQSGQAPHWFVSNLQVRPQASRMQAGDRMTGFRLRPGTRTNDARLLRAVTNSGPDRATYDHIAEFSKLDTNTQDALDCLLVQQTITLSAKDLGVSMRSLQRLIKRETGQSPAYWRQLARVRTAARQINYCKDQADIAYGAGFADQAHMSREFRRWFGVSPSVFVSTRNLTGQLATLGYG